MPFVQMFIHLGPGKQHPFPATACEQSALFPVEGIQYIPRNMHTIFALLCFVVVIHWLIFPYPPGLLHWHCGNLTIAPVLAKQPWWIWINISCEFIMNDCITTTKQSTTKPCAYFLGYTVRIRNFPDFIIMRIIWLQLTHYGNQCHPCGDNGTRFNDADAFIGQCALM